MARPGSTGSSASDSRARGLGSISVQPHTFVCPSGDSRRAVISSWQKCEHKVLVNCLGGLSLPIKSVVKLIDLPYMTTAVYCGSKTTTTYQHIGHTKTGSWLNLIRKTGNTEVEPGTLGLVVLGVNHFTTPVPNKCCSFYGNTCFDILSDVHNARRLLCALWMLRGGIKKF